MMCNVYFAMTIVFHFKQISMYMYVLETYFTSGSLMSVNIIMLKNCPFGLQSAYKDSQE